MIRQAVILAAGMGSRIRTNTGDLPKPLVKVDGVPMITRTALTLRAAGVKRIIVVVGFMGDVLSAAIRSDPAYKRAGIQVDIVHNNEYYLANGVSVIAAAQLTDEPFLLSMADHIYDVDLAEKVARADMSEADLYLCVDRRIDDVYDIDDATKVRTVNGRIVDIGKAINRYDCIDCGVFAVSAPLVRELALVREQTGDCSLSDGVRRLAERGRARVVDVGNAFWQDVDTVEARHRAERELRRIGAREVPLPLVASL